MSNSTNKRPIITHQNPKSPISEAYRTLRTNIQFSSIDEELKVIMVTSAGPGEGKSTTLVNLAVAYAQADKKVLVIDADLRKPTMHHTLQVSNRFGLTNLLTNQLTIPDVIQETTIPSLSIISSGPIPPNPSEILASKKMISVLDELKQQFDIILIDAPPAIAVTDSQIIATRADGVILVVDSDKVKRDAAIKAKQNLDNVRARILGVVLNNVDRKNKDAYYYYYYGESK
ncbi:CpsD/CapB family tyrosine-protein kinase [Paenibacillus aceris]|uniref:non-specific protein-tyrosine kinase n=1 Tax=Paenibacillus aceris TaxID=869555 RepID=A0ABS4HUK4_9BACL|nr:CpsD/CapB family tyrosine-protein kinase [Paenibacillus aceris]MBP1962317.1 capsular exopolysaccharide synthesis family protein [Paenibacillus aceris]NHW37140.1 CpsD/CapB family tyrosine-protein kinase [Paenibacillus aceris]